MTTARTPYFVADSIVTGTAARLLTIGREPICVYVNLWHGETMSPENSQHVSDRYTPSQVIHGILFYAGLWLVARGISLGWRFAIATAVEAVWGIVENSDAIIERYRSVTISLEYCGDSILNATADNLAMWMGFWLALTLPVWASVVLVLVIGFEALTTIVIRDGLALNILMPLWPPDAVRDWQAGG
jgi:hypothetical protein